MVSTNGSQWEITEEWAQPGGDDGNNLMSAVFAQDKFVAVGGGGGGANGAGHILVSRDGRAWKEVFTDKGRINPVLFGNGRFLVGTSSWPSGKLSWPSGKLSSPSGKLSLPSAKKPSPEAYTVGIQGFSHSLPGTLYYSESKGCEPSGELFA